MNFVSQPLVIPHCHWREFEAQCIKIPNRNEWYQVEQLQSGLWLCIQKNGQSEKNRRSGGRFPHDFVVILYDVGSQKFIWQPSYTDSDRQRGYKGLIPDLYDKLIAERVSSKQLIDLLLRVACEIEPRTLDLDTFSRLPGRPTDEILLTFKWLFAQEGVNYQIDRRKGGRLYTLYRIQELYDGVPIEQIIARCKAKGTPPDNLQNINYQRIKDIILK